MRRRARLAVLVSLICYACTDDGQVLEYRYGLSVSNASPEERIVVPTNGGAPGPHSLAYIVPPGGQIWGTYGETLGDSADPEVYVFDGACQLLTNLTIPRRPAHPTGPSPAYMLGVTSSGATVTSVPRDLASSPLPRPPEADLITRCPETNPPLWTT